MRRLIAIKSHDPGLDVNIREGQIYDIISENNDNYTFFNGIRLITLGKTGYTYLHVLRPLSFKYGK